MLPMLIFSKYMNTNYIIGIIIYHLFILLFPGHQRICINIYVCMYVCMYIYKTIVQATVDAAHL